MNGSRGIFQDFQIKKTNLGTLRGNPISIVILICCIALSILTAINYRFALSPIFIVIGILCLLSIKIAAHWERAVVLRLGKFIGFRGPGIFFLIPFIDTIPYWIDLRIIATPFRAEQTLTKDNVPVDVDAVCFWKVVNPEKAALEVADYHEVISWASQTALRDVIGKSLLSEMLVGREMIDLQLKELIKERTEMWGIYVDSVEIRDVNIPAPLQDAMSIQAQAERERQARLILGESETQIAQKFAEAAKAYINNPTALHLRAMNMLYEGFKDKGTLVIVPSTAVETMGLGAILGASSLTKISVPSSETETVSKGTH